MVVCQFLISGCLSMSLLISSPNTRVLDICLGNYEQDFLKSSGVQVCTIGKSWQRILCVSSLIIHTVMSSNVLDAIFLYICFNKIKHQTEKLKKIIGKKAYELRKRYVKHCRFPIPEDTQKILTEIWDHFWLKNDGEKWSRKNYFKIPRWPSVLLLPSAK